LGKKYKSYPETFEPTLDDAVVYLGKNHMTDSITIDGETTNIGKLLLSPTRTYAPLMKLMLDKYFNAITGLIHCSGGGQTKCMKYLPKPLRIVKDNLFEVAPIFKLIQENSGADNREMYQVFNMGHRLEVFTDAQTAELLIAEAAKFDIAAQVVGRVEASYKKELILKTATEELLYEY
jgi:phosphoribosylformylglycinamidine cyclo-ligase